MKVVFSGLGVTEASGKLGNDVTARTRHGFYTRTKGLPNFAGTGYQTAWNTILTTVTQAWGNLTASQIDAWNLRTYSIRRTRYLPSQHPCTGQRAFIHFNAIATYCGKPINTDPVTPPLLLPTTATAASYDTSSARLFIDQVAEDNGKQILLWATPGLPPGRRYWKNRIRLLASTFITGPGTQSFAPEYSARFATPNPGDFLVAIMVPVDQVTGTTGPPQLLPIVAT